MTEQESQVLDSMRHIIDPDLGKDIVTLGFIKNLTITNEGKVSFSVELTTPACPVKEHFRSSCEKAVAALPWVKAVDVTMTAQNRANPLLAKAQGLAGVTSIIAVSSCKGGVGKSTTAVNLAYALKHLGASVGLFDADIYGPSLPTMVSPSETSLYQVQDMIQPLDYEGVKLMSFGFVPTGPGGGAAIMRGPMVTQIINQLLTTTDWGTLDYLVLDLPPGTGDIQLTLTQLIPITAAIIVTTPQQLSFVDVVKGIQMFDKLKVPTISVVENMSYFDCPDNGKRYYLFGQGARQKLIDQFGIKNSFAMPIIPEVSHAGDSGKPLVLEQPDHPAAVVYREIAEQAVREISILRHAGQIRPKASFQPERGIVLTYEDGSEKTIPPARLRRACRCALCKDEFTGKPLLDPASVSDAIFPRTLQPMGNYAVAIAWSDGHSSSIYPYELIAECALASASA
ncbi:MAG TPA: P-loop NTPase [Kiritimatiellia bacterium]|nr:P-loop NTPase [Kiritimatiellia bacterium]